MENSISSDFERRKSEIMQSLDQGEISRNEASVLLKGILKEFEEAKSLINKQKKILEIEETMITDKAFDALSPDQKYDASKQYLNEIEDLDKEIE